MVGSTPQKQFKQDSSHTGELGGHEDTASSTISSNRDNNNLVFSPISTDATVDSKLTLPSVDRTGVDSTSTEFSKVSDGGVIEQMEAV